MVSITDLSSWDKRELAKTAKPDKYPQGRFKDKACKRCNTVFSPQGPSHHYCQDRCRQESQAARRYEKVYGVKEEDILRMYEEQGGCCKICGGKGFLMHKSKKHGLNLDHCHTTGKVRGWLCDNCNRALGLFQDSIVNLEAAIAYLRGDEKVT